MIKKEDKLVNEAYSQLLTENEEALTDAIELVNTKLQEIKIDLEKILKKHNVTSALLVADGIIDDLSIAMKPIVKDALMYANEAGKEEEAEEEQEEADVATAIADADDEPVPAIGGDELGGGDNLDEV